MNTVKIIGLLAAALSTATFLPQIYKTWKDKSTESLSFIMLLIYNVAGICWLIYGILIKSSPIMISNLITTILGLFLIWQKWWYQNSMAKKQRYTKVTN